MGAMIIFYIFAVLLGVLDLRDWLRLHPMNLICIITAQGNGMGIHCCRLWCKAVSLGYIINV